MLEYIVIALLASGLATFYFKWLDQVMLIESLVNSRAREQAIIHNLNRYARKLRKGSVRRSTPRK